MDRQSQDFDIDKLVNRAALGMGKVAKLSFLLSIITSEDSNTADRLGAWFTVLDDFEELVRSLPEKDARFLKELLTTALETRISDSEELFRLGPDSCKIDARQVDGEFVKRVAVGPRTDEPIAIASTQLQPGSVYVLSTEYTYEDDKPAFLRVIDENSKEEVVSKRLGKGSNRFEDVLIDLRKSESTLSICLSASNASEHEILYWYQTAVFRSPTGTDSRNLISNVCEKFEEERGKKSNLAVLRPVTGEPFTLEDADRLSSLRNRFSGERIFVMGNGPSLNSTPLELLENEYVFGLNRVSLLFDRVSWRPTFFTAFDVRVVPDNKEEFANLDVPYKFFSARYKELLGLKENHYWHHTGGFYDGFEACFGPDAPYYGFGGGGTIAIIAIELAHFMGFKEIYLIGTDVSYSVPKTVKQEGDDVFGDGVKLELESTQDDDANHFDPRYFGAGKKWHNPNVRDMKIGFARAASYVQRQGGRLLNATVGGELDEVRRVDFESLF